MTQSLASSDDWTAPGIFEVAPGVYRIPLPLPNDGLRAVNAYAIIDGDAIVLVDSGWAIDPARELLESAMAQLDCTLADIRWFLVTHGHRDHYAQAVSIRREFGNRVSLGKGERLSLEAIQNPNRNVFEERFRNLELCGAGELVKEIKGVWGRDGRATEPTKWDSPDEWLSEGRLTLNSGRNLDVVETPGHTRGHIVFRDESAKLLFAGDHVLPTITPSIGFESVLSPNPLGDFLTSLARVRQMPDAMLLPAHGQVTASVHQRIDELIDHHGQRLEATETALAGGATTAYEAAQVLRWTRRLRELSDLDAFNKMLAISETGAHLTVLVAQNRVTRELIDGVYHYQPV